MFRIIGPCDEEPKLGGGFGWRARPLPVTFHNMAFLPFHLERWQSVWEHRVRYNLAESGVDPLTLDELLELTETDPAAVGAVKLGYSQSNGTDELRVAAAGLYPAASDDQILVTAGSSEANFVACWTLLEPGDHVAVLVPNYLQASGVAANLGARVTTFPLEFERGWEPDLDAMRAAITAGTKLVVVTTPNNPTGHVLSDGARDAIIDRTAEVGAWLLVDEVYRGADRVGPGSESWWGRYDRLVVSSGLSKAYGLPGLRIGWLAGPPDFIREAAARHDYTVIGPSALSDFLAVRALGIRERLLERTRGILRSNYAVLADWLHSFGDLFRWHEPQAGAICLVEYDLPLDSEALVEDLRANQDVLLVPGTHLGLANHLRIGFGERRDALDGGLAAVGRGLRYLAPD